MNTLTSSLPAGALLPLPQRSSLHSLPPGQLSSPAQPRGSIGAHRGVSQPESRASLRHGVVGVWTSSATPVKGACERSRASRMVAHAASTNPKVMFLGMDARSVGREGITLPLQPVQLLGLNAGQTYKDSTINQMYDELMSTPLEPGYSQQTVTARADLLSSVLSDIICSKGKKMEREVVLPYELIPGALAIMAEVGHDEMVLYMGQELLDSRELDGYPVLKQDVLLSMAIAKYNAARDLFSMPGNQVSVGCGLLEEALHLLQPLSPGEDFIAPRLAREIRLGLAELQSHVALEQVSLPLEYEEERRAGVRTVRKLLMQAGAAAAPSSRPFPFPLPPLKGLEGEAASSVTFAPSPVSAEYVGRVMKQLTCAEVVGLQDWEAVTRSSPQIKWVYPGLLERVCVAHMLHGYLQCQPNFVKVAAGVLAQLPSSGEVLVLQAVCCVLMGAVQKAEEKLLEAETAAHARPSHSFLSPPSEVGGQVMGRLWSSQAFTFVADHTPSNEEGLLTGLCLYTELWLAKVAVPLFRDTADTVENTSLLPYFGDARVEAIISVYDEKAEEDHASKPAAEKALLQLKAAVNKLGAAARNLGLSTGMSQAAEDSQIGRLLASSSPAQRAGFAAVLVAGATAAACAMQSRRPPPSALAGCGTRTAMVQDQATTSEMGIKTAERVVRMWQEAKQAALGPNHDVSMLPQVLAEPMLGETWRKAASFREQGWFMRYKLHRMKIVEVDTKAGSRRPSVTVLASLDESASLCGMDGHQADGYRSSYDAQYQMAQGKDGVWRVSSVTVLGEDAKQ